MTKEREAVISFGKTIIDVVATLVQAPITAYDANPWIYVKILPYTAWYIISAMILSISTCFFIINRSGITNMHDIFDSEKFTLINGLGLSLTFFRLIYYNVNINCRSTRILFILSAISSYLLYIHYSAYLTAVSLKGEKSPINSFQDVLDGGYQVSVLENTALHDLLRYSKSGTAMNEVYHGTMKNRKSAFIQSYNEAPKILASEKNLIYGHDLFLKTLDDDLTMFSIQVLLDLSFYKKKGHTMCASL